MSFTRETYYEALFAFLQTLGPVAGGGNGTFAVVDRRVILLEKAKNGELPALYMSVGNQKTEQLRGVPPKRSLSAMVYLYALNTDRHLSAGIALNGLIDALEQAIDPFPATVQTLGGIVSHCWIEGETEIFEGPLGEKAAAIARIWMLVP